MNTKGIQTPSTRKALWGRLALLAAALIWGSSFFVMKNAVSAIPVFWLLGFRFTVGFGLLGVIFWKKWRRMTRRLLWRGALCGVLLGVAYIVQTFGLQDTTPGKNAFLTAAYCVLAPFVGWLFLRRRPGWWNWAAAILCLTGVGLVSLDQGLSMNRGDTLTLVCSVFYALHMTAVSRFGEEEDPVLLTMVQFGFSAVLCWALSLLTETPPDALPAGAWGELIFLAVFATTAALLLQNVGQSVTPASQAAILLSLESVFGVLFSVLFAGEQLTARLACGFTVIFLAVIVSETRLSFLRRGRERGSAA